MASTRTVLLLSALLASASCSAERNNEPTPSASAGSWYLRAQFEPSDTVIFGVPVRDLDSAWRSAVVLTPEVLPAGASRDSATLPTPDFGYRIEGDFNADGRPDIAVVGVFRTRTDSTGAFALIVSRSAGGAYSKEFAATLTGTTQVTFLRRSAPDTLRWFDCVECDADPVIIYWDGRAFKHHWDPEELPTEPPA